MDLSTEIAAKPMGDSAAGTEYFVKTEESVQNQRKCVLYKKPDQRNPHSKWPDCKRAQKVLRLNRGKYIFRVGTLDNKDTVENSSGVRVRTVIFLIKLLLFKKAFWYILVLIRNKQKS